MITFGGPLSLYVDLCTQYQIHQEWHGQNPQPPPSWQCQAGFNCVYKTSQELRILSSVTIKCQVTKIVMNPGSQLSVL